MASTALRRTLCRCSRLARSEATSGSRISFSRILLRKRSAEPRTNSFGWLRSLRIMLQMRIISGSRLPSGARFSTASRRSSFFRPLSSFGTTYWITFIRSDPSCSPFSINMIIFLSVDDLVLTSEFSSPWASSSVSARVTLSSKMRNVHCFSMAIFGFMEEAAHSYSCAGRSSRSAGSCFFEALLQHYLTQCPPNFVRINTVLRHNSRRRPPEDSHLRHSCRSPGMSGRGRPYCESPPPSL
eukprot:14261_2